MLAGGQSGYIGIKYNAWQIVSIGYSHGIGLTISRIGIQIIFKPGNIGWGIFRRHFGKQPFVIVAPGFIGILAAIAFPNFISWLPNMRLNGAARDLHGTIMRAKVEAAKCNRNCTLVFNQVIGGVTFAYVLFVDCNGNSEYDVGESILVQQQWPQGVGLSLPTTTFPLNDDGLKSISFKPNSIPTGNGASFANGTAMLTNTNGRTKSIIVNRSGNVRIQ